MSAEKDSSLPPPEPPESFKTSLSPVASAILERSYFLYYLRKKFLIQQQIRTLRDEEELITRQLAVLVRKPGRR